MTNKKMLLAIFVTILIIGAIGLLFTQTNMPDSSINNNSATQQTTYTALGLQFAVPAEFVFSPTDIGAEPGVAYSFNIPGEDGKSKFRLVLVYIPENVQQAVNNDHSQMMNYAKGTYLATTKPATEKVVRTFFGKAVEGNKQTVSIPVPSMIQSYLVELPNKKILFLGAKYTNAMPEEQANQIIQSVADTLTE